MSSPSNKCKYSAGVKFSLDQLDQSTSTLDSTCSQCRALDLVTPISAIERDSHAASILVANRAGLDLKCPLCQLFAEFIFPNRHEIIILSHQPWQLRMSNLRYMSVDTLSSNYFKPVTVAVLHPGSKPIDYTRHLNDEEVLRRGLLVCTKTRILRNAILSYDGNKSVSESRFASDQYDPQLVKTWLNLAHELEYESSDDESDDTSNEDSNDWNHALEDDSSEADSAGHGPEYQGLSENVSRAIIGTRYETNQAFSDGKHSDGMGISVKDDDSMLLCTHVSLSESYHATCSESLPELEGLSTEEQPLSDRSKTNWPSEHPNGPNETWLMKFIDCETLNIVTQESNIKYIALSYVWALAEMNMVDFETIHPTDSLQRGTLPPRIPRVVRDAIMVVRDIGYRWLWVDQYCIDQSNQTELLDQISKMDLIYSFADLTIVAANSRGSLPGVHDSTRIPQRIITLGGLPDGQGSSAGHFDVTIFTVPPPSVECIQESTWYTRGWCYQEAILSPRRLYFTDHVMLFEAGLVSGTDLIQDTRFWNDRDEKMVQVYNDRLSLSSPSSWEKRLKLFKSKHKGIDQDYGRFCAEFSLFQKLLEIFITKELTMETDILSAFRGVASVFWRQDPNFRLIQGIPILHRPSLPADQSCNSQGNAVQDCSLVAFVFALGWYHADSTGTFVSAVGRYHYANPKYANGSMYDNPQLSRRLEFPSWSWAGWKALPVLPLEPPDPAWEPRLTFHAVESRSGKVVKWADASLYFNQIHDDSRYLIGEASLVDIDDIVHPFAWSRFSEDEKAHAVRQWKANSWFLSVMQRVDKHKPLSEADQLQILSKLYSGAWSCLTMYLDRSSAVQDKIYGGLLVVAWEDEEEQERYSDGHKLRTCSRVGLLRMGRKTSPDDDDESDLFSNSYRARHRVHFRLG